MSTALPKIVRPVPEDKDRNKGIYSSFEWLYKAEKYLDKVIAAVMVTASLALAFLMVSQVIMRYIIKLPFLGIEECAPLLAFWAYFLGMAYSVRVREHIMGGILVLVVKNPSVIKAFRLFGTLCCMVVVVVFGSYVYRNAAFNLSLGRLSIYMRWPKYFWDFSIVVGFVLSGFYFVLQLALEFLDLMSSLTGKCNKTACEESFPS